MYIIYFLNVISSFLEGIGIIMLLPLLQSLDNSSNQDLTNNGINSFLYSIIDSLGLSDSLLSILILISIAFILKGLVTFFATGFTAYLIGQLLKEIKLKLFNLYSGMSLGYFSSKNSGDLINTINEQPIKALEAFKQLTLLGSHLINTLILMTLAFFMTFSFGLMASFLGLFLLLIFMRMNSFVQELSRVAAKENGILTKWLIQCLHGFKYLISTNKISPLKKNIYNSISILTNTQIKSGIAAAFTQSVREPIAVVFIMLIVYFQIFVFELRLEPILVSIALFYRSLNSTLAVQSSFQGTFQHIGSMELVHNEFINQRKNQFNDGTKELSDFKDSIFFDNVSFKYSSSNHYNLENINLKINSKSSIALIGESGAGKTTLADLITLSYEPSEGLIFIDDIPTGSIKKSTWRDQIGYVSQEAIIFDDTIANNISLWQSNDLNKLRDAAKQANILDFIESLPNGFNTVVGDRGVLLSGGQKQRIFIARELFRKPKVLILDEATSALDSKSEKNIQKSIESLKGKLTVIIIAHRLSTIKNVDKIYVIENGKIIEEGTYEDLKMNFNSKLSKLISQQVL